MLGVRLSPRTADHPLRRTEAIRHRELTRLVRTHAQSSHASALRASQRAMRSQKEAEARLKEERRGRERHSGSYSAWLKPGSTVVLGRVCPVLKQE